METFGAGNAPGDETFRKLISNYIQEGGIVLNITQCSSGSVEQGKYETSSFFTKAGIISGKDMTTEAAITKLMYVLGSETDIQAAKKKIAQSIQGEVSL